MMRVADMANDSRLISVLPVAIFSYNLQTNSG
jgi:hypothetical protein